MPRRPELVRSRMLLFMLAVMTMPIAAEAFDMAELMALMSRVESSRVTFEETKYVSTLTAPIVRRGTLRYDRPDRMEMLVESPYFERMDIIGNTLTIESKRGIRQIDLAGEPGPAAWVAGIRATLAGDRPTLARHFAFDLRGQAGRWTLALLPRDPALSAVIQRIVIDGEQSQLTRIEVEERVGDRTVLIVRQGNGAQ